ncbi:MAG TPA: hypothetical protein VJL87_04910 [Bdellovibrionota bacterium]|nr:hypothetical protein [Bdellovibrionota bacterium]
MSGRAVHFMGVGTIGEPLVHLFLTHKTELGVDEITFHKNSPKSTDRGKLTQLLKAGAKLVCDENKVGDFTQLGFTPSLTTEEAVRRASVVIDSTPSGTGLEYKAKLYSRYDDGTRGFLAQGSEAGFGHPYAYGINDETLPSLNSRFIHIVSCNTHALSVLIKTIAGTPDGLQVPHLEQGTFVCLRRASDVGEKKGISSPELGTHKDKKFGTHHAKDAHDLYLTKGIDVPIYSSAVKFNTQYMHTIWFHLRLKEPVTLSQIKQRIVENPQLSVTEKSTTSEVFQFGRDNGFRGRILNQAVIPLHTLSVSEGGKDVIGYAFTPQDGNSLVSSVAATMWFLHGSGYKDRVKILERYYLREI